jgi:hypothetical protein
MRGGNALGTEMLLHLLEPLCFIDGRATEWDTARGTFVQGCRWVRGHFEFQHRRFPHNRMHLLPVVQSWAQGTPA